jgi:hypothetical protein
MFIIDKDYDINTLSNKKNYRGCWYYPW